MTGEKAFISMLRGETRRWNTGRIARYVSGRLVLYALAIGLSVLFVIPFAWMISTSLKSIDTVYRTPFQWIPRPAHFENYWEAWNAFPFTLYLRNTIVITVFSVAGDLFSCSLVAYGLARVRFPARGLFFALLVGTMLLPGEVTFIPRFVIMHKMGWVNTFLPLIVPSWLATGSAKVFLLRQFFRTIPGELEDAARIDGAGFLGCYWRIILPLSKPALAVIGIYSFIGNWNSFLDPLIYLNRTDLYTLNVGLHMFQDAYAAMSGIGIPQMHWFMAIATLILLPIVVLFLVLQRFFVTGITLGGVKG
jgi:ABC-type glycerol-3-phosphate transport system permease component